METFYISKFVERLVLYILVKHIKTLFYAFFLFLVLWNWFNLIRCLILNIAVYSSVILLKQNRVSACIIAIISMTWCSQAWNESEPCYCDYTVNWSIGWPMGTMNWNYPFHDDYCDGGKNNWKLKINYAWKCCHPRRLWKRVIHHLVLFVR